MAHRELLTESQRVSRTANDDGGSQGSHHLCDDALRARSISGGSRRGGTGKLRDGSIRRASEIARVYAFRGEKDLAFQWLNRAYDARDEDLYFMKDDPLFKNLAGDPRYKAVLRKMNLPE